MAAVAGAPLRIRPWLVLAGWCGLRACEIAGLRRENVLDTARPPVLLIAAGATKGNRERIVPVSGFVLGELQAAGLPRSGWVFPRADGHAGPNRPHNVSHLCNDYLHDRGYPETLHQLRHRFGTMMYRGTRDLRLVQDMIGHASPSTTAGYAMFDNEPAAAAAEALPFPARLRVIHDNTG
jgi:integrase/recombinase XerC